MQNFTKCRHKKKTCSAVMNINMTVILMRIINNSATFVCVEDRGKIKTYVR